MYPDQTNTYYNDVSYCKANNGDMITFWDDTDVDYCIEQTISQPGYFVSIIFDCINFVTLTHELKDRTRG